MTPPTMPPELPTPRVLLLGPPQIVDARGSVEPGKRSRLTEYAAFLVVSPGAGPHEIDDAIWPDRRPGLHHNTRNTATAKLRAWFGKDDDGADYLPRHPVGGYRFSADVGSDLDRWRELVSDQPSRPRSDLAEALGLVRGRPLAGHHPRRYAWADRLISDLTDEIRSVAVELGIRQAEAGDWRGCLRTSTVGLSVDDVDENLWRLRILSAHSLGDAATVRQSITRLGRLNAAIGAEPEAETLDLMADLGLAGHRSGPACTY